MLIRKPIVGETGNFTNNQVSGALLVKLRYYANPAAVPPLALSN